MATQQPPMILTTPQTPEEQKNIDLVLSYMNIAYSPERNKGGASVAHLCTSDSEFVAPTTFPGCTTLLHCADGYAAVMPSLPDLHLVQYDWAFAKDNLVLLRYTATASHCGTPYAGVEPTGKRARWTAAAIFEVREGKIHRFTKDWDKMDMWKQLGWMKGDEYL